MDISRIYILVLIFFWVFLYSCGDNKAVGKEVVKKTSVARPSNSGYDSILDGLSMELVYADLQMNSVEKIAEELLAIKNFMNMKGCLLFFVVGIALALVWYEESRSFFCLKDGSCVTLWKRFGTSYIIPGKYYGISPPSEGYIESPITEGVTIWFSAKMPKSLVFQSSEDVKVMNGMKEAFTFYDYMADTAKYNGILYRRDAKKRGDVKEGVEMMDIYIHNGIALDRDGVRLGNR